jgi:dUTP pyrophosphatase
MQVSVKFLNEKARSWDLPLYQTELSAGLDLRACIEEKIVLEPNQTLLIGTGIAIFLKDPNCAAVILPRSGLGHKQGLILGNTIGLIDADYQGELKISCWNRSSIAIEIEPGMRIAQLVVLPILKCQWNIVESFEESERGQNGFGSTGTHS